MVRLRVRRDAGAPGLGSSHVRCVDLVFLCNAPALPQPLQPEKQRRSHTGGAIASSTALTAESRVLGRGSGVPSSQSQPTSRGAGVGGSAGAATYQTQRARVAADVVLVANDVNEGQRDSRRRCGAGGSEGAVAVEGEGEC